MLSKELTPAAAQEIADATGIDIRTVKKVHRGERVRGGAEDRARQALEAAGHRPPTDPEVLEARRLQTELEDLQAELKEAEAESEKAHLAPQGVAGAARCTRADEKVAALKAKIPTVRAKLQSLLPKLAIYRHGLAVGVSAQIEAKKEALREAEARADRLDRRHAAVTEEVAKLKTELAESDDPAVGSKLAAAIAVETELKTKCGPARVAAGAAKQALHLQYAAEIFAQREQTVTAVLGGARAFCEILAERLESDEQLREDARALRRPPDGDIWNDVRAELERALSLLPKA